MSEPGTYYCRCCGVEHLNSPASTQPPAPKPSEELASFLAAISDTDRFVETSAEGKAGIMYRFADGLLGTLRAELTRRIDALKSRGA